MRNQRSALRRRVVPPSLLPLLPNSITRAVPQGAVVDDLGLRLVCSRW
jgi:hypothetical protein